MCKVLSEPKYCTCTESGKGHAFLGKHICPTCGKPTKVFAIGVSKVQEPIKIKPKHKYHKAMLLSGVNRVVMCDSIDGFQLLVDPKCLNIIHKKDKYPINYPINKIHYSNPMGFESNDPRFRPFKTGLVKGFFTKDNTFFIEKNINE